MGEQHLRSGCHRRPLFHGDHKAYCEDCRCVICGISPEECRFWTDKEIPHCSQIKVNVNESDMMQKRKEIIGNLSEEVTAKDLKEIAIELIKFRKVFGDLLNGKTSSREKSQDEFLDKLKANFEISFGKISSAKNKDEFLMISIELLEKTRILLSKINLFNKIQKMQFFKTQILNFCTDFLGLEWMRVLLMEFCSSEVMDMVTNGLKDLENENYIATEVAQPLIELGQTPLKTWDDAQLIEALKTGDVRLEESKIVREFRMQKLLKEKRGKEMLNYMQCCLGGQKPNEPIPNMQTKIETLVAAVSDIEENIVFHHPFVKNKHIIDPQTKFASNYAKGLGKDFERAGMKDCLYGVQLLMYGIYRGASMQIPQFLKSSLVRKPISAHDKSLIPAIRVACMEYVEKLPAETQFFVRKLEPLLRGEFPRELQLFPQLSLDQVYKRYLPNWQDLPTEAHDRMKLMSADSHMKAIEVRYEEKTTSFSVSSDEIKTILKSQNEIQSQMWNRARPVISKDDKSEKDTLELIEDNLSDIWSKDLVDSEGFFSVEDPWIVRTILRDALFAHKSWLHSRSGDTRGDVFGTFVTPTGPLRLTVLKDFPRAVIGVPTHDSLSAVNLLLFFFKKYKNILQTLHTGESIIPRLLQACFVYFGTHFTPKMLLEEVPVSVVHEMFTLAQMDTSSYPENPKKCPTLRLCTVAANNSNQILLHWAAEVSSMFPVWAQELCVSAGTRPAEWNLDLVDDDIAREQRCFLAGAEGLQEHLKEFISFEYGLFLLNSQFTICPSLENWKKIEEFAASNRGDSWPQIQQVLLNEVASYITSENPIRYGDLPKLALLCSANENTIKQVIDRCIINPRPDDVQFQVYNSTEYNRHELVRKCLECLTNESMIAILGQDNIDKCNKYFGEILSQSAKVSFDDKEETVNEPESMKRRASNNVNHTEPPTKRGNFNKTKESVGITCLERNNNNSNNDNNKNNNNNNNNDVSENVKSKSGDAPDKTIVVTDDIDEDVTNDSKPENVPTNSQSEVAAVKLATYLFKRINEMCPNRIWESKFAAFLNANDDNSKVYELFNELRKEEDEAEEIQ